MFVKPTRFAIYLFLLALVSPGSAGEKKIRIVMVGDSTMANLSPRGDRPDLTGWGQVFGEFFTDRVEILNHAMSGRSSLSFIKEGRWEKALAAKPDWVFIQFGHNDQKPDLERATSADGTFRDNLRKYVDDARQAGARPVLVTPVARRTFSQGKAVSTLGPYADATKAVAKEKGVPLIDLHAFSLVLFEKLGDEGSSDLSASKTDRSHWSRKGAMTVAALVAEAIRDAVPELKGNLRK